MSEAAQDRNSEHAVEEARDAWRVVDKQEQEMAILIAELNRNAELIPKLLAIQAIALELREQSERDSVTHVGDLDSEIVTRLFAYLPREVHD